MYLLVAITRYNDEAIVAARQQADYTATEYEEEAEVVTRQWRIYSSVYLLSGAGTGYYVVCSAAKLVPLTRWVEVSDMATVTTPLMFRFR